MPRILLLWFFLSSLALAETADSSEALSPKKAALWAIIPGAGQVYNGKYLKAGLILSAEIAAIWRFQENSRMYSNYEEHYALPQSRYLDKRNKYAWWIFITYFYGIIDAVVDAHLAPFNEIMQEDLESAEKLPETIENRP